MKTETINGITKITAEEGRVLTNKQTHGKEVWLSKFDKVENWQEVDPEDLDDILEVEDETL